jgi:hypothetical protein
MQKKEKQKTIDIDWLDKPQTPSGKTCIKTTVDFLHFFKVLTEFLFSTIHYYSAPDKMVLLLLFSAQVFA